MSPLEVIQLVGYATGAILTFWMSALLRRWRRGLGGLERVLFALGMGIGLWHTSNFALTLLGLFQAAPERWPWLLRISDTVAVVSIVFSYSFLLHIHLYLWANARGRGLTRIEKLRVWASYIPVLFLSVSVPHIWTGSYAHMLVKLAEVRLPFPDINYVHAFMLWAIYVLCLIAVTELFIARIVPHQTQRRIMRLLASSFFIIAVLIGIDNLLGVGQNTAAGRYLITFSNLGSLLPTALLAYSIYRHRYLELAIRESLVVATFAAMILVVYLFGIRTIGEWFSVRYGLRSGVVESLMILALALLATPLRRWLEKKYFGLFQREATLYRDVVQSISSNTGAYQRLPELLHFVEERIVQGLGLRRVQILTQGALDTVNSNGSDARLTELLALAHANDWQPIEGEPILRAQHFDLAFTLRRDERSIGAMLIDAPAEALTPEVRAVLEVLAGQVAIAIEDCRLVEENLALERRVAQGERLAALGQMAATVAHEVKNPLSAIKSIAQVMHEDENLRAEYGRDLTLIVGETDRLSRSVTQMLNFARQSPQSVAASSTPVDELMRSVVDLFRAEAAERELTLEYDGGANCNLESAQSSGLRDAASNLILNAMQASPPGGRITLATEINGRDLSLTVADEGAGIAAEVQAHIWEPFYTTKQRGTGLGLAIVRKRLEEVGGTAQLLSSEPGAGSVFRLSLPLAKR
ncbi:MAG: ATP-binding protein [Pyrinomonadaceae bacterium]